MNDYLKRLIYNFLFYRRATLADTEWFLDKGHNADLVPQFDLRIGDILDSFDKYRRISYDTQGVRDHGIDVLLRYDVSENEECRAQYIGFQIKSYKDLHETSCLTKLKAQIFDAKNHIAMVDFYLVICTDARQHLNKLRDIQAELAKDTTIHIVRPEYARTFFRLSPQRIGAYLKARLSEEDQVYKKAFDSLSELTPHQAAIVIELIVIHFLEGISDCKVTELRQKSFIQSTYSELPNLSIEYYYEDQDEETVEESELDPTEDQEKAWIEDLAVLESQFIDMQTRSDIVRLDPKEVTAVAAVTLDGHVRYGYSGDDLRNYLLMTLMEDKIQVAEEYQQK